MKFKTLTLLASLMSAPVLAGPIFLDVGTDYGDNGLEVAGPTTTGWKTEMQVTYDSETVITDSNGDGVLSPGDMTLTQAGLNVGGPTTNQVTTLLPTGSSGAFPDPFAQSDNGYGGDWALSFYITNLAGTITATGLSYQSGTISVSLFEAGEPELHLFDLIVTGGAEVGNATFIGGDISNFGAGSTKGLVAAGDVFNAAQGSFQDIVASMQDLTFFASTDTQGNGQNKTIAELFAEEGGYAAPGGTVTVTGQHEGGISFVVPEPNSIAILALGLLGLGASRRKAFKA